MKRWPHEPLERTLERAIRRSTLAAGLATVSLTLNLGTLILLRRRA